jgi:hypothetical protein
MTLPINPRSYNRTFARTERVDQIASIRGGGFGSGLNGATSNYSDSLARNTAVRQNQSQFDYNDAVSAVKAGANTVSTNIGTFTSGVGGAISDAAGAVGGALQTVGGSIAQGLQANFNAITGNLGGAIGNLLGFPQASKVFATEEDMVSVITPEEGDWRVQLKIPNTIVRNGEIIYFPVVPNITLSHKANYSEIDIVHSNYPFVAYKNSKPDDITISCEWPVESIDDAKEWLTMVRIGRTLTKMFYGQSIDAGQPPPICTLKGFSFAENPTILPDMPVICKGFQFELNPEVGYVGVEKEYVPRSSNVTFTLATVYPRVAQRSFDIGQFAAGKGIFRF